AQVYSGRDGSLLRSFAGSAGEGLGISVAGPGDLDGDGYPDLVLGAYLSDLNGKDSGAVHVVSGRTGLLIHAPLRGASAGDRFGLSVTGPGDLDRDGVPDIIAGSPPKAPGGSVTVYSGRTFSVLHTFGSEGVGDSFGQSVEAAGDVNADGFPDV